ncbi:unnamed protein product, partial [marine sediment metagenome]
MKRYSLFTVVLGVWLAACGVAGAQQSIGGTIFVNGVPVDTGADGVGCTNLFTGAGTTGLVTSAIGDAGGFLRADGLWGTPAVVTNVFGG